MEIALIILSLLIIFAVYIGYNLFKKVERLEQIVDAQDQYITGVSSAKLEEIDEKGTFHSDDEIGWFFESIKTLQRELNDFNINGRSRI